MKYNWPGNVRELKNCVEGLVVMSTDQILGKLEDLPERILSFASEINGSISSAPTLHSANATHKNPLHLNVEVGMSLEDINREVLRATLAYTDNNKVKASQNT